MDDIGYFDDKGKWISENPSILQHYRRDLDGMAATILDCLTKSGRIQDDKRQIVSRLFVDYELCKKGQEGFRVRIIT